MSDLVIIGGGPAGLTAGLYAARAMLDVVLLEKMAPGGQILTSDWVENYPGFPEGISGFDLVERMKNQAERFGLKIESREVTGLKPQDNIFRVTTTSGEITAKSVILASGATPRKLGIEGEGLLTGKGVSYCATCDGPFYRDQEVAVIGGGDTAVQEAIFLTRFARKVYLIHRRDQLRATKVLQERAKQEDRISIIWDTIPVKILGTQGVDGIEVKNVKTGQVSTLPVQGVFVFIGYDPNSQLVRGLVDLDEKGFVVTDPNMATSVPGLFAAGDVRSKMLRQVSTAVGEAATAAVAAEKYLEEQG